MADKHIYKKRLTPDKMKYAGTRALNLRFQASTTTARTRSSTNTSAATTAYSPPTRNSILAPDGPASRS